MQTKLPVDTLSDILFARAYAYDILRRFFLEEPSEEYLKHFVQHDMVGQFPFMSDSALIREGVEDIKEHLTTFDVVNKRADYEDLHWDYTRMIVGPLDLPVPPWESVYVRHDKLLFQAVTMGVRKEYEKFGFEVSDYNIEADDHIGLELDFMYHLTNLSIESAEAKEETSVREVNYLLEAQKTFLTDHLLKFAPELSEKMIENAETQFYVGLGKILKGYLQVDLQVLEELINIEIVQ